MTSKFIWIKSGLIYRQAESSTELIKELPNKIYTVHQNPKSGELFLEEFADSFTFGFKVYNLEADFINHIISTYEHTTTNLGVLMNGIKGTGKTACTKMIANRLGLPVLLINTPLMSLADFIAKIECPLVLMFDEFEKNFNTKDGEDLEILSIMDGVYNSPYRRVFLLTTNNLYINENLIGRPSRIRYRKSFGNLSSDIVKEYIDDNLVNKEFAQDILDFVDTLSISTIDILKSIVEEVNIHNASPSTFKGFFNIETAKYSYNAIVKWIYDDEDYSLNDFRKGLATVGTTAVDEDGDEYIIELSDLSMFRKRINSNKNAAFLHAGDEFADLGKVVDEPDLEGYMTCENEYGHKAFLKIMNLENKPSLYRGSLVF